MSIITPIITNILNCVPVINNPKITPIKDNGTVPIITSGKINDSNCIANTV